jgi:hypothetical protein
LKIYTSSMLKIRLNIPVSLIQLTHKQYIVYAKNRSSNFDNFTYLFSEWNFLTIRLYFFFFKKTEYIVGDQPTSTFTTHLWLNFNHLVLCSRKVQHLCFGGLLLIKDSPESTWTLLSLFTWLIEILIFIGKFGQIKCHSPTYFKCYKFKKLQSSYWF